MWPFDDPQHQIPANIKVPKLGPAPLGDVRDLKIIELEQRVLGMEQAVIEMCKMLRLYTDICQVNFHNIDQTFLNLISYVMRPRVQIIGDSQEKN